MIKTKAKYDLEDRTLKFAKDVRLISRSLPRSISNIEDIKQLIRASGSVGANYIEANEAFSKKDFIHRIKICRKEVKEARYWLKLIEVNNDNTDKQRQNLVDESSQLMNIFGAIIRKIE